MKKSEREIECKELRCCGSIAQTQLTPAMQE